MKINTVICKSSHCGNPILVCFSTFQCFHLAVCLCVGPYYSLCIEMSNFIAVFLCWYFYRCKFGIGNFFPQPFAFLHTKTPTPSSSAARLLVVISPGAALVTVMTSSPPTLCSLGRSVSVSSSVSWLWPASLEASPLASFSSSSASLGASLSGGKKPRKTLMRWHEKCEHIRFLSLCNRYYTYKST